ncbi:MAG: hypothetical protein PWQ39_157 [Thermacetogenium sp.]|nr:hypothetical protein [Thermacetogenium sp.]
MARLLFSAGRRWPLYLAILAGVAVALFSWFTLNKQIQQTQTTVSVVVPKEDIDAFAIISPDKLVIKEVLSISADKYTAREIHEVAGMLTTAPLYAGKPVDVRYLEEPSEDTGNYHVVGVNIDAARAAGVKAGDVVDVYWLKPEQGAWAPTQASQLIATNVRVLRVCDERGQPIMEEAKTLQSAVGGVVAPNREPKIVYLVVKPEDVPLIIGGSAVKSTSIALARKPLQAGGVNYGSTELISKENKTPAGTSAADTADGQSG